MSNDTSRTYDLCIVGAGMIGSSAARHAVGLSREDGRPLRVCLVGPDEPQCRAGRTVFGAYYDEGRITRSAAHHDPLWSILAARSAARYRALEHASGVRFYDEVGCLYVSGSGEFLDKLRHSTAASGAREPQPLTPTELRDAFPYLFSDRPPPIQAAGAGAVSGLLEVTDAGVINPRRYCAAAQTAARKLGRCEVLRDVVGDVREDGAHVRVRTEGGRELMAEKVLLATGAFTDAAGRRLLPPGLRLDLRPCAESVIFVQLSADDSDKLRHMPSIIVRDVPPTLHSGHAADCYILPPIKYPDGKMYIKLGHGSQFQSILSSPSEVVNWYLSQPPNEVQTTLQALFRNVFPSVRPVSVHYDTCATTLTPTRRPYVDLLSARLGVALGGNGLGAKCCDELGRLAAQLVVTGRWTDRQLDRNDFKIVVKSAI